jgi:hypothetical protein
VRRPLTSSRSLSALVLTAAAALALLAQPAAAAVLTIGRGLGDTWRLESQYRLDRGRSRTVHYAVNDGNGCPQGPGTAARVDWYRGGVRVAWKVYGSGAGLRLIDVATTRRGDRSPEGLVVGRATFSEVRRRLPKAKLMHPEGSLVLGPTMLSITKVVGYDNWVDYAFWFDRRGRLVALETDRGGC